MVTIFTPTYNRSDAILHLGDSLKRQTCCDFEWLIIDDGSTDNTAEAVKSMSGSLPIRYYYQNNSGKHIAFNKAIRESHGERFVCVDDDDLLEPNAVEVFIATEMCDEIGLVLPRNQLGEKDADRWRNIDGVHLQVMDLKWAHGITESVIVFQTEILKRYQFPVFLHMNGTPERYCPEEYLYFKLAGEGTFRVVNKCVYRAEYREDGLTRNLFRLWKENPHGAFETLEKRYRFVKAYPFPKSFLLQMRTILNWNALCFSLSLPPLKGSPDPLLSLFLLVPGKAFQFYRFKD